MRGRERLPAPIADRPSSRWTPDADRDGFPRTPCDTRPAMGTVEEVRIARRTGFCYGVREAIDKAKEAAAAGKPTHTLGQVVHNEGVIRDLQELGDRRPSTRLDDVDHGAAVVIRAHGVTPEVMERAEERGLEVIDGTCTWVIQEQRELSRLVEEGYTIVLLGTPKHPEVVGLLGFAPDAIVVDEEEDWDADPAPQADGADLARAPSRPGSSRSSPRSWSAARHELKIVNTRLPGHDPAPGGHAGARRARWTSWSSSAVGSSANTKELTRLVRDRRHAGHPDRERARPDDPTPSRAPGSSASRAAHPRRSRTCATSPSASTSSPAPRSARPRAPHELAAAAPRAPPPLRPAARPSLPSDAARPSRRGRDRGAVA